MSLKFSIMKTILKFATTVFLITISFISCSKNDPINSSSYNNPLPPPPPPPSPPQPPTQRQSFANAGPDIEITLPLDSVYLDAGQTCSSCSANYQWSMISGPSTVSLTNYFNNKLVLAKDLIPGNYQFQVEVNIAGTITKDTMELSVINDPAELNTITYKKLKWDYFLSVLLIMSPAQPNLFFGPDIVDTQIPSIEYLQVDNSSPWLAIPATTSGILFSSINDSNIRAGVARHPADSTWLGKESNFKIKIL